MMSIFSISLHVVLTNGVAEDCITLGELLIQKVGCLGKSGSRWNFLSSD